MGGSVLTSHGGEASEALYTTQDSSRATMDDECATKKTIPKG